MSEREGNSIGSVVWSAACFFEIAIALFEAKVRRRGGCISCEDYRLGRRFKTLGIKGGLYAILGKLLA